MHPKVRLRIKGSHFSAELVESDADILTKTQPFLEKRNILPRQRRNDLGPGSGPYLTEWPHV